MPGSRPCIICNSISAQSRTLSPLSAHFLLKGQFWGCRGSSFPSNSTTYSSLGGRSGGYGFPPPNSGRGLVSALDFTLAPTVWICCKRCVSVLRSSIGCVLVLAARYEGMVALEAPAVAILSISGVESVLEPDELDPIDRCDLWLRNDRRSLLSWDHCRVAWTSARSMSRSTISIIAEF
jgi:hypothetical protein